MLNNSVDSDFVYQAQPTEERELNQEEVVEYVNQIQQKNAEKGITETQQPPLFILKDDLNICPQSLVNTQIADLIQLQAQCEEYHVSPYSPTWLGNPNQVIEGFEAVKMGKNIHWRHKRLEDDMKAARGRKGKLSDLTR